MKQTYYFSTLKSDSKKEVVMIQRIWQNIIDWFVQPFPSEYDPKCFDCNLGPKDCPKCEYRRWKI